jgi:hypothetical protein
VINLLVPHFVRTIQNNSLASSARQTNFVNLKNSLNSSRINLSTAKYSNDKKHKRIINFHQFLNGLDKGVRKMRKWMVEFWLG